MMNQLAERKELGLFPRLIAAGCFGGAACIPIGFFLVFATDAQGPSANVLRGIWPFVTLPMSIASLLGFTLGSRTLDPMRTTSAARATMRGILVAILSYLVMAFMHIVILSVFSSGGLVLEITIKQVGFIIFIYCFGAILVGWLIVIAGAIAGLSLYHFSRTEPLRSRLMKSPRANKGVVYRWIGSAVLLLIAAHVFVFLLGPAERLLFRILDRLDPM